MSWVDTFVHIWMHIYIPDAFYGRNARTFGPSLFTVVSGATARPGQAGEGAAHVTIEILLLFLFAEICNGCGIILAVDSILASFVC